MSPDKPEIAAASPRPAGPTEGAANRPEHFSRDYQELWFTLARQPWRSAVLVPAEPGLSADDLATALAGIGRRLGFTQVSSHVAEQLDFNTVGGLTAKVSSATQDAAQIIVAIPPVVVQPLGVAVARAADAVVLCVALGQTPSAQVARTIELVGRERIRGAVVITPRG